jgi:hypothetical protein
VIDLHPNRAGRTYSTAWDTFGLVGHMPIVAVTIASLLTWLLEAGGDLPAGRPRNFGDAHEPAL